MAKDPYPEKKSLPAIFLDGVCRLSKPAPLFSGLTLDYIYAVFFVNLGVACCFVGLLLRPDDCNWTRAI